MNQQERDAAGELVSRARAGDGDAFRAVTAPYRQELLRHCYRMLGSLHDAEDALQETMLAAWQGFGGFEARSSVRTWLYRIATNRCLNARRAAQRRQPKQWDVPGVQPPDPTRLGEVVWLEPVLVLRDVLGFRANEVAEMVDTTTESVTSALKRARAALHRHSAAASGREAPPPAGSSVEQAIVAEFVRAYESNDLDALVALLTDDVFMSMPPMPLEYEGRDVVRQFLALFFGATRRYHLVPTRANGQPALGVYVHSADGLRHGTGLFVLTIAGDRIRAMTRFENTVLPWFGLPRSLPSR